MGAGAIAVVFMLMPACSTLTLAAFVGRIHGATLILRLGLALGEIPAVVALAALRVLAAALAVHRRATKAITTPAMVQIAIAILRWQHRPTLAILRWIRWAALAVAWATALSAALRLVATRALACTVWAARRVRRVAGRNRCRAAGERSWIRARRCWGRSHGSRGNFRLGGGG
jgi:hypothetical protein